MTAMTSYLAEAHILELRESRRHSGSDALAGLLEEALQVLKGGLLPVDCRGAALNRALRQDLNLD